MKKLLSFSSLATRQILIEKSFINLTYKPKFYARNIKRKPDASHQNQKQSNTDHRRQAQGISNASSQKSNSNYQQNIKAHQQVRITGPKRLWSILKQSSFKLIPYYIKTYKNPIRNFPLPYKKKYQKKEQFNQNNLQSQFNSDKTVQEKQNINRPYKIKYQYKSSSEYLQKLLKKYRIIQALKSSRITDRDFGSIKWKQIAKLNLQSVFRDNQTRNKFKRYGIYSLLIPLIFIFKAITDQAMIDQPQTVLQKQNQMTDTQILNKLRYVKQIRVNTNTLFKPTVTFVMNQPAKQSFISQLFKSLGFQSQTHQKINFYVKNPNILLDGLEKVQQSMDHKQWIKVKPNQKKYHYIDAIFDTLFLATPFIGIAFTYWIFTKMNPQSMLKGITSQKKSMKIQSTKDIKVRFKDVAGMQNAKKQITQFVDFLKKSDKYVQMGAKIPKGALLTGPPGTGKTMLAKACAGQAGTSFFYVSGSQFVEMFVGLGAARVRQLFARARQQAPSIIFIDQIDAIGKKRETSRNQQKDSTLNQMLVQMDGFSSSQTVIVLAATNRKDILDSALTRPGRFDRMVEITLPQLKARQQIFMVHLAPLKINPEKPLPQLAKRLAQLTPGFSGADIANLCNQAAIIATRKKRIYIQDNDFQQASERIMAGYVKKGLSNQKTKKRVAYHEAGHAVCGWYLRGGDPLVKLTIIPRSKGALGYAQYLPKTAYIRTRSQLIDQIAIMLGGTTSEQIFLGNMSSGNSDDLQKVYGVARRMIAQFGMGQKTYNMTLDEQTYVKKQSEKLCNLMDKQILQVVNEATERAKRIIQEKRQIVEQLAKQLLQKQTINNDDILRIMGERPVFN